jgi:hypothetical protein
VPPRSVSQSREIKDLFRTKIKEKVAREKAALRQRVDDEVPSWLAWAVKPLAPRGHRSLGKWLEPGPSRPAPP